MIGASVKAAAMLLLLALAPTTARATAPSDSTAVTLAHCLDDPANAATAGQSECETAASKAYDRRMNAAYATLLRQLPVRAAGHLRSSQRAWIVFRDSEATARDALYESRQGTMYVPMQASAATAVIRDRALQLEGFVRVMAIE